MHTQRKQAESKEFARLDRAILGLLVTPDNQRPWSEAEIERKISASGNVAASLDRLHRTGLVHHWNGMVSATHAAVRFEDTTQSEDPGSEFERRHENAVLEVLLSSGSSHENPTPEKEIQRVLDAQKTKHKLAITDALTRLDGAGLVERRGELAFASPAAVRFDQIMDL